MRILSPPGSHQVPQANVHPNPSSNTQGHAPSIGKHALPFGAPKFSSNLEHNNGNHHAGQHQGAPGFGILSQGFTGNQTHTRTHMEQTRKSTATPAIGAGRGGAAHEIHNSHQKKLAAHRHMAQAHARVENHAQPGAHKQTKLAPPHSIHPDTVKKAAGSMQQQAPKAHGPGFGVKSMQAEARKPIASTSANKPVALSPGTHPAFASAVTVLSKSHPLANPGAASAISAGQKAVSAVAHTVAPKVMPQATKTTLGLPAFTKAAGPALKPQPAKPVVKPTAAPHAIVRPVTAMTAPKPVAAPKPIAKPVAKPVINPMKAPAVKSLHK